MKIKNIIKFINDPAVRFLILNSRGFYNHLSDEEFLKKAFRIRLGYNLNLENPRTFNEKLQWLKLYDRKPEYTMMVDKYAIKQYVAGIIGEQYIIPTLGVWEKFDEIEFEKLPNQFVLKCTHDSGGIVTCNDKKKFNLTAAKKKIETSLLRNYYWHGREWPYKDVKPRIIAEKYMENKETKELRDYKFFSFDGETKALFIATDRQKKNEETKFDFFDMNFNHLDIRNGHPNSVMTIQRPQRFEEMHLLANKLSKGIPHVRVDFYEVNGKVYFGEMTFSHWSGFTPFEPEEWDYKFGEWIKLPKVN